MTDPLLTDDDMDLIIRRLHQHYAHVASMRSYLGDVTREDMVTAQTAALSDIKLLLATLTTYRDRIIRAAYSTRMTYREIAAATGLGMGTIGRIIRRP